MIWQPQLTSRQLEERRLTAGRLLQAGQLSQAEIARQMGVSRTAVCTWAKRLQGALQEISCLANRPRPGRPPRLTPEQWQDVLHLLRQGAQTAGFEDARWTLQRVRTLIQHEFSVTYHARYLSRRLKASGWSVQKPAVVAAERDEELVRAWLRQDWPRIKKGTAARRAHSVCG
jgi:transposase